MARWRSSQRDFKHHFENPCQITGIIVLNKLGCFPVRIPGEGFVDCSDCPLSIGLKKVSVKSLKGYFLIKIGLITLAFCSPELSKIGFIFGFILFHLGCGLIWSTQLQVWDPLTGTDYRGPQTKTRLELTLAPPVFLQKILIPPKVANLFRNRMSILCVIFGAANGSNSVGLGLVQVDFKISAPQMSVQPDQPIRERHQSFIFEILFRCIINWVGRGLG